MIKMDAVYDKTFFFFVLSAGVHDNSVSFIDDPLLMHCTTLHCKHLREHRKKANFLFLRLCLCLRLYLPNIDLRRFPLFMPALMPA